MNVTKPGKPKYKPTCEVSDQACKVDGRMAECFGCGNAVCTRCSSRRRYLKFGVKRLCNNCQIERLDNGNDHVVLARLRRLVNPKPKRRAA